MKVKKCIVCKRNRRARGEKLCKTCLDYYKAKYGIRKNCDMLNNKELQDLIKAYNKQAKKNGD